MPRGFSGQIGPIMFIAVLGFTTQLSFAQPAQHPHPVSHIENTAATERPPIPPLSSYDFKYQSGLYATITLEKRLKKVKYKVKNEDKYKLKDIAGFKKELKVRVLWQMDPKDPKGKTPRVAPLAIPLLGLMGRNKDRLARRWQYLLYQSGCHVMTFDSVFSEEFGKHSMHGASGNISIEAKVATKVINAFLKHPEIQNRITNVRLLGTSYGGTLALEIARQARSRDLGFPLGQVLALSPTIDLQTSAHRLDQFFQKDFGYYRYDMFKLLPLRNEKIVEPGQPLPFSQTLMKAGIGYIFRGSLKKVVEKSDKLYKLGILKRYKNMKPKNKLKSAKNWSFVRYVEEMSYAYWKDQEKFENPKALWETGNLTTLLEGSPKNVHVVEAMDDPLNNPKDLIMLQSSLDKQKLTVLPTGGHLGYATCDWIGELIKIYFQAK